MNILSSRRLDRALRHVIAPAYIVALAPFAIGSVGAPGVSAQSRATPPEFEVVSIRPLDNLGGVRDQPGLRFPPGRITSTSAGVTVRQMIAEAYQLTDYQLLEGPKWLASDRFAVQATARAGSDRNAIRRMLQTMLVDRFKLVTNRTTKEMDVYALTLVRGQTGPARVQDQPAAAATSSSPTFKKVDPHLSGHTGGRASAFVATTMEDFAVWLSALDGTAPGSALLGRPVIDRTGLTGRFNFTFAWNDDDDVMTALRDILGLRLASQKATMDALIIRSIERPSPN